MKDQSSIRNQPGPGGNPSILSIHGFFSALGSTVRSASQTALLHLNRDPNAICYMSIDHSTQLRPYSPSITFPPRGVEKRAACSLAAGRLPPYGDFARVNTWFLRCILAEHVAPDRSILD
ncbi:hypothetical protein AXF42_Ash004687 [Apostasia shenzhenica]|uniref:Uncharacterized protein n=1 Tax=Apostasia shenzhenica TaxID=1088818 RepID=A0A2I0BHC8_9ASPA|nr:hypothetical protein AXF42_Ash004687 [Apostasia shenzhenica]